MTSKSIQPNDVYKVKDIITGIQPVLNFLLFAETITRYLAIKLPNRNWLTIHCLIMLLHEGGNTTTGELGKKVLRTKASMTRPINDMVEKGLVRRYRSKQDHRSIRIQITKKGLLYMIQLSQDVSMVNQKLISFVDSEKLNMLLKLSNEVRHHLLDDITTYSTLPGEAGKQTGISE